MGRKKQNKVYRYFTIANENKNSTCLVCNKLLNTTHGANLTKHLKHIHKKEYEEIEALNKNASNSSNTLLTDNSQIIKKECTNLVTIHGRPLALLNDKAFQNILAVLPDLNMTINSKKIRNNIYESAASLRMDIARELQNKMICIKVDIASLSKRSFMGVNAQFAENGHIILKNLAMLELFESHTAEHLKEQILFILQRFRIGLDHVLSFTTDNGANMLKMSRLVSQEIACESNTRPAEQTASQVTEHLEPSTSRVVLQEMPLPQDNNQMKETEPLLETSTSRLNHQINLNDESDESDVSECDTYYDADVQFHSEDEAAADERLTETVMSALLVGFHVDNENGSHRNIGIVRCAAHTLQLAILKTCEDARIKEVISSARSVAKRLLSQTYINKIRASGKKLPILDCVTRWNSTADMIERLLDLKSICDNSNNDPQTFIPSAAWEMLQEYLISLGPARILLKSLQSEQLTLGDFLLQWLLCKIELGNLKTPLSLLLFQNMSEREQVLFENDSFINAIFLDPRVNSTLSETQQITAKKNLVNLHMHLRKTFRKDKKDAETEAEGIHEVDPRITTNIKRARLELNDFLSSKYIEKHEDLSVLLVSHTSPHSYGNASVQQELDVFVNEPLLKSETKIFYFWESKKGQYPRLYELAQVILATPSSQVSVERLFSSLKFVVTRLRYNLKADLIENIIFLRNNSLYDNKSKK